MSVKNEGFLHLEFSMISSLNDSYRTIISVYGCDPYTFKKDMLVKYYNNEISFDLVEFKNSRYSNIQLPNREKIIVNMQVDDEDFECLLDVCSNNGIGIDELKNATFFEFSILDEYDYTILANRLLGNIWEKCDKEI